MRCYLFSFLACLRLYREGNAGGLVVRAQKITRSKRFPSEFDFRFSDCLVPSFHLWHAVGHKWIRSRCAHARISVCVCVCANRFVCLRLGECAWVISKPLCLLRTWPGFLCQVLAWSGAARRGSIHPEQWAVWQHRSAIRPRDGCCAAREQMGRGG